MRELGIDRRAFLRGGATAGVAAASLACRPRSDQGTTRTKSSGPLVVRDIGGSYGAANRKAVHDPFTRETGIQIKVVNILHEQMITQIKEGRPGSMSWTST
ncbi:twin-arginine translocation signal domain-containing protein [Streptomyces coeruleorubidus]|uniref:twin-arginine translocation signal domain-containing protein n=1 Tax=Streptomyces coeruleorubidus TaxID=116188 RepID=UPI00315961E3